MNWPGLLKWSLSLQGEEEEKEKAQPKPMDEETKKWLSQALDSYAVDDVQIMKDIIENLKQKELGSTEDEEFRLLQLEDLQDLLDQIDKAKTLVNLKGLEVIFDILQHSQYESNKITAHMIFAGCNQNNAQIQQYSINNINSLQIINDFLNEKNMKIKEFLFSSLSSLIRGENLEVKRIFISIDGLMLIKEILTEENKQKYSEKLQQKALLLLKDLIFYDNKLHQTYGDLEPFANTNCQQQIYKQKPNSLVLDEEQKKNFSNFKEENKKYENCTKQFLIDNNYLPLFRKLLGNQNQYFIEGRESVLAILTEVIKFQQQPLDQSLKDFLAKHLKHIKKQNIVTDGLYENEIIFIQELFK